jgi:hypothetical protein
MAGEIADDDTVHIVEEGGEFFCVRQGCGTRRGPFTTKTAALAAAYVLTGLIDQNPIKAIAASIGPSMTGRIATPDGSTFIDFNNMTCDPATFSRLEADGLTHGLMPAPLDARKIIEDLMDLIDGIDDGDGAYVKLPAWQAAEAYLKATSL